MATYYVNFDAVSNGTGTNASPFNVWSSVASVLAGNDTAVLHGTGRNQKIAVTSKHNITLRPWTSAELSIADIEGDPACYMRGDTIIPAGDWTDEGDGTFSAALTDTPISFVGQWDAQVLTDREGGTRCHYGHYTAAADQAGVIATAGAWWWNGSDTIYMKPATGHPDPDEGGVYAWCVGGNCIVLTRCNGWSIRNLNFYLWVENASGQGQAIDLATCNNTHITGNLFIDIGYHAISGSGNACSNNYFARNRMLGCAATNGTCEVFYSGSTAVSGCLSEDNDWHLSPALKWNKEPLIADLAYAACKSHGVGSAGGAIFYRNRVWGYATGLPADHTGSNYPKADAFNVSDGGASPVDRSIPSHYQVQFIENIAYNCSLVSVNKPAAFVRNRVGLQGGEFFAPTTNALFTVGNVSDADVLLESNEIIGHTGAIGTDPALLRVGYSTSGFLTTLRNNSIRDLNTSTAVVRGLLRRQNADAAIACYQNVFAHNVANASVRFMTGSTSGTVGTHVTFVDNWYYNMPTGAVGFSPITTPVGITTQVLWIANVDANGIYGIDPGFTSTSNLEGTASGAVRTTTKVIAGGVRGSNQRQYGGWYGAYQYGAIAFRGRSRGRKSFVTTG